MKNKHNCPLKDWARLNKAQKKIYNSVRDSFRATQHDSAFDVAIQGGVRFQFVSK